MVGSFYVDIEQVVLMFRSKTRVLTPRLENSLEGFHHRASQRMAGMVPNYHPDGT